MAKRVTLDIPGAPAAEVTGRLAVARAPEGAGFVVWHVERRRPVLSRRLKRDALAAARELEALDWGDEAAVRRRVLEMLAQG